MRIEPAIPTASAENGTSKRAAKLKKACEDFESLFVGQILKSMRKTIVKSDLFGSSREEELFQDMMDQELSKAIARTGSVGIADLLYSQLRGEEE